MQGSCGYIQINITPLAQVVEGALACGGTEFVVAAVGAQADLVNLSTRGQVGVGDDVLIGGLIIEGTEPATVLIRARGPSLAAAGVPGTLADQQLQLFSRQTVIESNNDWAEGSAVNAREALLPQSATEAAILRTLEPGGYTAIVSGLDSTSGVGIVEIFRVGSAGASRLANISTRGQVGLDDDVLIAGLIVEGPDAKKVVIRGRGPRLGDAGVSGILADPFLTLFAGQEALDTNDTWSTASWAD